MNIEKDFNEFYNKFVNENQNIFDEIELSRRKAVEERKLNKKIIFISEIILLCIVIILIFINKDKNNETITAFAVFSMNLMWIIPMIIVLIKRKELDKYDSSIYKEKVIKKLIESFYPNLEYIQNGAIDYNQFKKIDSEHFNRFCSSDIIKGVYNSCEITIAKVITDYDYYDFSANSNGSGHYETFDGLFAQIKLPYTSNIQLYLKRKTSVFKYLFNIFLGDLFQVSKSNSEEKFLENNYDKVKVKELRNIFNVYSSNLNSAEYILDSEISKILIDIYNTEKFEIAIKDNIIYMKFWITGLFSSPPLEKETFNKQTIYKNYKMLYLIFYLTTKLKEKIL